jgi:phosphoribosylanthranilate isomerase
MRTRFKICCMASVEEMRLALRYGAAAVGLVSAMPSGPGPIDDGLIAEIAARVPPGVASFLLTCRSDAESIIDQQRRTRVNTIQLCDRVAGVAEYGKLRAAMPGIGLVQVIHVTDENSVAEAIEISPHVDAILLDSGNQSLKVKELGGTGRVHDWTLSARIVRSTPRPVYLAGGLNPTNVAAAIAQVRPFAVDVCSGLRTDGKLDEEKLASFVKAFLPLP